MGWTAARVWDATGHGLPRASWITAGLLAFLAALLLVAARAARGWVVERRYDRRMDPLVVSRLVALAKAAALAAAVVVGGYAGLALALWQAGVEPARLLRPAAVVAAGGLVLVAGLLLERACHVPPRTPRDMERDG